MRPALAGRTAPGGADVRVAAFGGLAVDGAGLSSGALAGQRKCLALLAILAVAGRRGIARDKLMALLGPDADMSHARNALSQVVFRARRALGQRIIEGKEELALNANQASSDVGDFERALADRRLEDAVMLYRGPFLDGFYLREAREFERWTADVRSRLERDYVSALDTLAAEANRRGDLAGAVAWCGRRMDADPLSSVAARRLVQALVANGDRDGALRFGLVYTERMRLELDVDPDVEFSSLLRIIRSGRIPAESTAAPAPGGVSGRGVESASTTDAIPASHTAAPTSSNSQAAQSRARARAVGRLAAATAAVATLIGSTLLLGSGPGKLPLVLVGPFVNATGDPAFDTPSRLAADWTTQGIAATGRFTVAEFSDTAGTSGRDGLSDKARRRDASLVVLGELSMRRSDSVGIAVRVVRARDGAILLESELASGPVQSPEMLARMARERAIGALATLLRRSGGRLPTD